MTTELPILFLAFANDRQADGAYLRNLGQEAEQLRDVLADAEKTELCQVELLTSVSAEGILKRFNDPALKGRIALFHYAGHAEDYDLLLENTTGERALADGRGLAAFLRQQTGLQLVFLNACSTRVQVEGLLDAGIAAVIATSRAIDDQTATAFARHFYTGLAGGDSIRTSFEKAQATLQFIRSDLTRHLRPAPDPHAEHGSAGWPWALYLRKGAEEIAAWNLPNAANNPLFGLDLPAMDLPAAPYPEKLQWYDATYAPVFFGRGYAIRDLYNRVTAKEGEPIILFYGQSGVGKSSLLAAGLLPRLAASHSVVYIRRDQNKGLLGSLLSALAAPTTSTTANVLDLWRNQEAVLGKPIVILLDQVEEVYTHADSTQANEMVNFLAALCALFLNPAQRPQGKLILSFRKEWLAEIDKQMKEAQLPCTPVFLRRIDGRGVSEAVWGPTRTSRLQQKYGLSVDEGLAEEIAHDLVEDAGAAVAPTLQILLSKLWAEAKQINRSQPRYDHALYDRLRSEGYLLKDFLDQQLKELQVEQAAAVTSGLALDVLAFHASEYGAAEHTRQTLHDTYRHVQQTADWLLQSFQRRYLLVDPAPDQENTAHPTRLAHDTLAPLVRTRFDESDLPGQRARRILETRAVEWAGVDDPTQLTPLDRQDLQVVETGAAGMRVWTATEQKLIEASRVARQQLEQRERLIRRVLWGAAIAILFAASVAGWQWRVALNNEAIAVDNLAQSQTNHRRTTAHRLALTAEGLIDENPQLAILLAAEGIRVTQRAAEETVVEARETLIRLLGRFTARPLSQELVGSNYAAFTPDGSSIVFADDTSVSIVELDPFGLTKSIVPMPWSQGMIQRTFGPVGAWFIVQSQSEERGEINNYVIDLTSKQMTNVEMQPISLSVDGHWLIVIDEQHVVHLVDTQISPIDLPGVQVGEHLGDLQDLVVSDDGFWLATLGRDGSPQLVDLRKHASGEAVGLQSLSESRGIRLLRFSQNGRWLAAADTDDHTSTSVAKIDLWRLEDNTWRVASDKTDFFGKGIDLLDVSPHGNWMGIVGWQAGDNGDNDSYVSLWNLGDKDFQQVLPLREEVNHIAFSSDDRWIAAASQYDSTVRVWDLTDYAEAKRDVRQLSMFLEFDVEGRGVSSLRFLQSRNSLLVLAERPQLWHLDAGNPPKEPFDFLGRQIDPGKFVFSPNKDWMVTLDDDGPPWLWMFEKDSSGAEELYSKIGEKELLSLAAQVAGRNLTQAEWNTYIAEGEADTLSEQTFEEFSDLVRKN